MSIGKTRTGSYRLIMGWDRSPLRPFGDVTDTRRLTRDSLLHLEFLDYYKAGEFRQ